MNDKIDNQPVKVWWAMKIDGIAFIELAGSQEFMLDRAKKYNASFFTEVFDAPDLTVAMKIGKEKLKEVEDQWQKKNQPKPQST